MRRRKRKCAINKEFGFKRRLLSRKQTTSTWQLRFSYPPHQVIELVMEVVMLRQKSIEHRLRVLFTEGDANGDGVLSFEEFNTIVTR